jgi:hypothetical protein
MTMTRKEAMQKVADAAVGENLIGFGPKLKGIFGETSVSFVFEPAPMHVIKSPDGGEDIVVINAKYAEGPDHLVGEIAIG